MSIEQQLVDLTIPHAFLARYKFEQALQCIIADAEASGADCAFQAVAQLVCSLFVDRHSQTAGISFTQLTQLGGFGEALTIDQNEVAKTALWLCSDLGSGVTGEVVYVDAGYHILGMPEPPEKWE